MYDIIDLTDRLRFLLNQTFSRDMFVLCYFLTILASESFYVLLVQFIIMCAFLSFDIHGWVVVWTLTATIAFLWTGLALPFFFAILQVGLLFCGLGST